MTDQIDSGKSQRVNNKVGIAALFGWKADKAFLIALAILLILNLLLAPAETIRINARGHIVIADQAQIIIFLIWLPYRAFLRAFSCKILVRGLLTVFTFIVGAMACWATFVAPYMSALLILFLAVTGLWLTRQTVIPSSTITE